MTVYDLNLFPNSCQMQLVANTAMFPSPLTGSVQTLDRGGYKWRAVLEYRNVTEDDRATLMTLIAQVRGQANRIRIQAFDDPARGTGGGTGGGNSATVNGAGQTGNSIDLDAADLSVTNWIRAGDYISLPVNGERELKMCTADADSDGSGLVTVEFEPALRDAATDGNLVRTAASSAKPKGIFLLENNANGWTSRPGHGGKARSDISLVLIEDLFASQS